MFDVTWDKAKSRIDRTPQLKAGWRLWSCAFDEDQLIEVTVAPGEERDLGATIGLAQVLIDTYTVAKYRGGGTYRSSLKSRPALDGHVDSAMTFPWYNEASFCPSDAHARPTKVGEKVTLTLTDNANYTAPTRVFDPKGVAREIVSFGGSHQFWVGLVARHPGVAQGEDDWQLLRQWDWRQFFEVPVIEDTYRGPDPANVRFTASCQEIVDGLTVDDLLRLRGKKIAPLLIKTEYLDGVTWRGNGTDNDFPPGDPQVEEAPVERRPALEAATSAPLAAATEIGSAMRRTDARA